MSIGGIMLLVALVTVATFSLVGLVHASRHRIDLEDYMVSRNQFGGWAAFATVVASTMGAWILFSPPEVAATSGIAGMLGYCIGQSAPLASFAWIGPRIRNLMPHGHSLNEYVLHRFGNIMYLLTLAIVVFYMFIYIVAELTAIAKAVQIMANVPLGWTALVVITATFIYTIYGGLSTTIFTDALQFTVIVPLLILSLIISVVAIGDWATVLQPIQTNAPELLSLNHGPGLKFGATLVVAILSAEIFNQGTWQRVYACRSNGTVQRSFLSSALVILPLLVIAGLLGLVAMHFGFNDDRAFFSLIQELSLPIWMVVMVLVLALTLVMSSLDTLLNGITSVFTTDLIRLFPQLHAKGILRLSRVLSIIVGAIAILIAARGYNVLYLFLLADLVCAGALVPVVLGLYSSRLSGAIAVVSSILGIGMGGLFFPKPDFTPWNNVPFSGDLLISFLAPIIVSTMVIALWNLIAPVAGWVRYFDFEQLNTRIHAYTDVDEETPEMSSIVD